MLINQSHINSEAKQYKHDIFGNSSNLSSPSLVFNKLSEEYQERLLKEEWTSQHKEGEKFYKYFAEKKPDQFANCMTAEVRSL